VSSSTFAHQERANADQRDRVAGAGVGAPTCGMSVTGVLTIG
jgi:hypothetical protein